MGVGASVFHFFLKILQVYLKRIGLFDNPAMVKAI
jgi:hypothetical protein